MKTIRKILKWIGILLGIVLLVFLILLFIPEKEKVSPIQPRESTRYWTMSEGFKIAYTHLSGEASLNKSPVVFLHGGPGGYIHSSIIETMESLAESGHDVYLYDQRGSGLSDRLEKYSDVSFKGHLQDLDEIISDKIGAQKVVLIGQSFGSMIIAHYSALHQEKIEKIIFCSPATLRPYRQIDSTFADLDSLYPTPDSLNFKDPYDFVKDVDNMAMKPKAIVATLGALLFDKKLVSDTQMDRMLNTLASQFTKGMVCDTENVLPEEGGGGLYAYLATNSDDYPIFRDVVQEVEVPVLVMQGQCDYQSFASAYEYVDLYPNSNYQLIEDAGHEIWWEREDEFIRTLAQFIDDE